PAGRARGVALHESFGSIVAEVAEVSLGEGGEPRVHRVVCAVDCGQYVNPDTVVAQMESGIVFGLSAALYGEITIDQGRPAQSNFDSYQVLRIDQMPLVETHIVAEGDPMGGIGEPGTPPIAPAVCNALLVLTGKPVRRLPIVKKA
ncbi:MAG TPA: molybdopterin cofactor-binding domain-containing protein, partial [Gemmatimonadales bacterium]|nr:molybdopterin cofactor-binding domain-containing protein [Gemmatimonadales bacterium]